MKCFYADCQSFTGIFELSVFLLSAFCTSSDNFTFVNISIKWIRVILC